MSILRKISLVILSNIILVSSTFSVNMIKIGTRTTETWNPIKTWMESLSQGTLIALKPIQSCNTTNLRASSINAIDLTEENASQVSFDNIFKLQGSLEGHIASDDGSRVSINIPDEGACILDWSLCTGDHFFTMVNGVILQGADNNINLLFWDIQPNIMSSSIKTVYNNINGQSLASFIGSMVNPVFTGAGHDLKFITFEPGLTFPACRTWGLQCIMDQKDLSDVINIIKLVKAPLDPQREKGLFGDQDTTRIKGATAIQEGDSKMEISISPEKDELNQIDYYHLDIMSSYVQKTSSGALNKKNVYHKISFLSNIFTAANQNILYKFKLGRAAHIDRLRVLLQPWVAIDNATLSNLVDQAWTGKQIYLPQASNYMSSNTPWCCLPAVVCANEEGDL